MLLGKDFILSSLEKIAKKINADLFELSYVFKDDQLTRFANNSIHQNVAERNGILNIKLVVGKKIVQTSLNSLEEDRVNFSLKRLYDILEFYPEDPDFISLPNKKEILELSSYDEETASCSPERRAELIKTITDEAEKHKVLASGQCNTSFHEIAVTNSLGVAAYNNYTRSYLLSLVLDNLGAEGAYDYASPRIAEINPYIVAEKSVSKCVKSKNPIEIEPNHYPVVLEAFGVSQLVEMFAFENFGAKEYLENKSCVCNKLGEKITGELISIYNDPFNEHGIITTFDMEGNPTKKVPLIEKGIAKNILHNSYTAHLMNTESTGNQVNNYSSNPYPNFLTMDEGTSSIEEMISSIENGIYVSRLNYLGIIEPRHTITTGLTRAGTFLIKNGKIDTPIHNLRFTDSILELFANISMLSKERKLVGESFGPVYCPSVKIDKFRFTGKAG